MKWSPKRKCFVLSLFYEEIIDISLKNLYPDIRA